MPMTNSSARGADAVVTALEQIGTKTLFVMSGNQLMPVFDALVGKGFTLVHVRHEAAAVHMADAWGRLRGEPGIALLPAGPGFLNGMSALYSARMSESPVVVLTGHAPVASIGKGSFQEMQQAEIAAPLCKDSWTVEKAEDLGPAVLEAAAIANAGRPGPVHVALPFDLLNAGTATQFEAPATDPVIGADADLSGVAAVLGEARKPLILAGPLLLQPKYAGLADRLSQASGIPVVAGESPRGINDPALGAYAEVLAEADCILMLGKRADYCVRFGDVMKDDAKVIFIDPESDELTRARNNIGDRLSVVIEADVRAIADRLAADLPERGDLAEWAAEVSSAIAYRPAEWDSVPNGAGGGAHPVNASKDIARLLEGDDPVLVVDGGEFGQWAQAMLAAPNRIINGPSGAIGGGLPYAIGAKLAKPDSTVIALMGDGTAGFQFAEFDTAARYGIPVVAVIGNDERWNAEYQIQLKDYGPERLIGCELGDARYDLAAAGLGCHGEYVEKASDLPAALERARASGKPACINLRIDGKPAPVVRRKAQADTGPSH